jgi:hypothetical protein
MSWLELWAAELYRIFEFVTFNRGVQKTLTSQNASEKKKINRKCTIKIP